MSSWRRHRHIHKRDAVKAALVIGGVALGLCITAILLRRWEDERFGQTTSQNSTVSPVTTAVMEPVLYQGVTWVPRQQLETYLFMGIDVRGPAKGVKSYIGGGQADVQLVLVIDHANQTWQMLQINRDSMVEVQLLGVMGTVAARKVEQITLAHAYGSGLEDSCINACTAVSGMLGGHEIDGYMALNLDAVSILNDLVGGVTLTVTSDFSAVDPTLVQGETITLKGDQALTYVRSRRGVDDQTNLSRMSRQRQYLDALQKQMAAQDAEFAITAYDAIDTYMVTDIGSGTMTKIGEYLQQYQERDVLTVDGESTVDDRGSNAYILDEDSLQKTILELFYQPEPQ